MKNLLSILICIIIFCTACGNSNVNSEGTSTSDTSSTNRVDEAAIASAIAAYEPETGNPYYDYTENAAQNYWGNDCHYIKETADGYYLLYFDLLYYFDKTSAQATVVCSSLGCNHTSSDCSAYFGEYGNNYEFGYNTLGLEIYDNNLYVIGYEINEVCDFYLYRVSMDGSDREKICYLYSTNIDADGSVTYMYTYTMHNGYLYGSFDKTSLSASLTQVSSDGEVKTLFESDDYTYNYINGIRCYGDYVYFQVYGFSDYSYSDLFFDLYRYNINTDEVELFLKDFSFSFDYLFIDDDNVLYGNSADSISIMNISSGESRVVCEFESQTLNGFSYDGKYIYVSNGEVYTVDGELVDNLCFNYSNIRICFGDSEYLFADVYASLDFTQVDTSVYGGSRNSEIWVFNKALIGSEDKNWTMLTGFFDYDFPEEDEDGNPITIVVE